jgi:pimeloyl-ACP methyl ester carboxylesterase
MANFVLVHGATVGGWCWRWVAKELRATGHEVHTPTMTGLGERVHLATPDIDLDTHIEDIVNVLHFEDLTEVVLVGWSYGGMVVAGVADRVPERIAHVVYLDSDVPSDGDTSVPPSRHAAREELARAYDGWRVPLGIDTNTTSAVGAWATWLELPRDMRVWIAERIVPHLLKTWTQPIRLTGAASAIPTTYVRCTVGYDPADEDTQRQDARIRGEPAWSYVELAKSHLCPWTAPSAVVDLLLGLL